MKSPDETATAAEVGTTDRLGSFAPGSRFSATPKRVSAGRWLYRNFRVVQKSEGWRILSACGDHHPTETLKDAMAQIDAWYLEGSVEW